MLAASGQTWFELGQLLRVPAGGLDSAMKRSPSGQPVRRHSPVGSATCAAQTGPRRTPAGTGSGRSGPTVVRRVMSDAWLTAVTVVLAE